MRAIRSAFNVSSEKPPQRLAWPGPADIKVDNLSVTFTTATGEVVEAVRDVSFEVPKGGIVTLLGPSGCGKTTTLRSIGGLEQPSEGRITIGSTVAYDSQTQQVASVREREVSMVFQSYAIWPHMDVFANVAFPMKVRPARERASRESIRTEVARALEIVDLSGYESRQASELSGGQRQRLALARALVQQPRAMLLDEPLSNLDAKLRKQMRYELKELQDRLGITMLYVTHDQEEALALSDNILVMRDGSIQQGGSPEHVYSKPSSQFVADFLGSANFVTGSVRSVSEGETVIESRIGDIRCRDNDGAGVGADVIVAIRPEFLEVKLQDEAKLVNTWSSTVISTSFLGPLRYVHLKVDDQQLEALVNPGLNLQNGDAVFIHVPAEKCSILTAPVATPPARRSLGRRDIRDNGS